MRSSWMRRLGLAAITSAVGWFAVGCAAERAPINQVQANAMSKSFFVGKDLSSSADDPEFYMRNTVIDVPYGASQDGLFTATYAQPLGRIKWEISEQYLIARQTYQHIENSDGKGSKSTNDGQVVAMFAVTSHFDIRRTYNPQTGEENNVVTENASDRPWYQREYFRVDWSKNLETGGYEVDTLSQIGVFGGVKFEPISYYVADPASPDAPVFAEKEGYFDVTTKAFATPQVVETPFGSYPACFLPQEYGGSGPIGNCNPTEVTLRLSFKAVEDHDFEPIDQTGQRQDAFGWFTVERYGYERNYGILDEQWHRFAAKYNIWEKSHLAGAQCAVDAWRDEAGNVAKYKANAFDSVTGLPVPDANGVPYTRSAVGQDVHRDANKDGTEDECEFVDGGGKLVNPGSRCDEFTKKCTLPLYARTLKTIPWYFGKDAPPDLFASTANALQQWNLAVKRAAQIGKKVEAKRVFNVPDVTILDGLGKQIGTAVPEPEQYLQNEDELTQDNGVTVPDVFVLCHNPVVTTDNPACGAPGLVARIGDIRYNSVNLINNPQAPSPWGIMVDADDPLTGEKVSTSVNEWAHVLDIASQGTEDLLRWINGEITDDQVTSGAYLRDWVGASALGTAPHVAKTLTSAETQTRVHSVDLAMSKMAQLTPQEKALPMQLRLEAAAKKLSSTLGPSLDSKLESTRQQLVGSKWEAQMVTPEWLQAAGMDPSTPIAGDDKTLAQASPLRGQNPLLRQWIARKKETTMASHAACAVEEPEPDALVGMARQAGRLYPLPDAKDPNYPALKAARDKALHQWIREQFHIAVIAHEMGHSMGLRHNFTGTTDPLNYHTEYWQLRTQNGKEKYCKRKDGSFDATTKHANGADCVGPRWVDPVTDTEVNGLIWKWGSSTVMDYPGDVTQDMNNIGPYDKAAMRFGYADIVDVDTDTKFTPGDTAEPALRLGKDPNCTRPTPPGGVDPCAEIQADVDKSKAYASALDGFGGISGQTLGYQHYSTYADLYGVLGKCSAPADASKASDPLAWTCTGPSLDYVAVRDMKPIQKYSSDPTRLANFALDPKNRVRHPYMFGSDEYADTGNVPVFRFDSGADPYEQYQFLISTYENRYIFDNFRRDRATFNTRAVVGRDMDRYFDKVQGMTKSLALLVGLYADQASYFLNTAGGLMPLALGASDSLKMFARIMTRPEPGQYFVQAALPAGITNAVPYATTTASSGSLGSTDPDFVIPLGSGQGRYLHNDYDYSQGYYWSSYQKQVGSSFEKSLAVWYLTEAYNHFLSNSKEDYIDGRYKNLNYASLYPNQMRRLFSQILQNDHQTFAPFVSGSVSAGGALAKGSNMEIRYLPWESWDDQDQATISLDYPKDAVVLDPLLGWEQQYRMLIDLFYMGPTTLSMDMVDQLRVFSPGGSDTVSIDPSEQVRYRDPSTGLEYIARNYGLETVNKRLGSKVSRSMGARMIQFANKLASETFVVDHTDSVTGELAYVKDSMGQPVCKDLTAASTCVASAAMLKNYAGNLDVVRQLTSFFGYGPLGHGE
jgi:hypothetical protein